MLLKRLPGLAYKYKWISMCTVFLIGIFISALFWGFICVSWEPWSHLKAMCSEFGQNKITGDLCPIICSSKTGVDNVSCVRSHRAGDARGRRSIFTATLRAGEGTQVVFKSLNLEGPFEQNIFNWAQNKKHKISELIPSPITAAISRNSRLNRSDQFFQDNEYLLIRFYEDRDIFPSLIGHCGKFYITEYLRPAIAGNNFIDDSSTSETWAKRVHLAVELLQLIEQIDQENLLMCQVTPAKFGLTVSGKVKMIDVELTLPKSMVDSITSSGKSCSSDRECSFHDCKSVCNLGNGICDSPVINTNLQIVCEKIFVGWSLPGRLLVPGLLMSVHTPMILASLLRQCAHDTHSQEISSHVATRLSDTLAEIDISLEQHRIP